MTTELTPDLLHPKGRFGFVWFVGNGGLNEWAKRARQRRKLVLFDFGNTADCLLSFMPGERVDDGSLNLRIGNIGLLVYGMSLILKYRIFIFRVRVYGVYTDSKDRRKVKATLASLDEPDPDAADIEDLVESVGGNSPEAQPVELGQARTDRRRRVRRDPVSPVPAVEPDVADENSVSEPEEIQVRRRKRRRVSKRIVPTDSQLLRLLSEKAAELNPRANIMVEANLPAQPQLDSEFYMGLNVDRAADQQEFLRTMRDGSVDGDLAIPPLLVQEEPTDNGGVVSEEHAGDRERVLSRIESSKSPQPNIQQNQASAPRRVASVQDANSFELRPVHVAEVTRRPRRARRLNFYDEEPTIPMVTIQKQVNESKAASTLEKLRESARGRVVKPQSPIGLGIICRSGRRIPSNPLSKLVNEMVENLPLQETRSLRRTEVPRAESSSVTVGESVEISEIPRFAEEVPPAAPSDLEVTGGQSGSHIEQELSSLRDISGSRVVVSAPAANTDESLMEFSTYATPRGSPNSEHFNNLDKMNTSAPLVEERFITFEDLVPPATSKRLDAARMFSALLKQQHKRNIELIQHEPYGTISIKILKPAFNPSITGIADEEGEQAVPY